MTYTTIRVHRDMLDKLASLREYTRETYEDVLRKLVSLVPSEDEEGEYSAEFRASWIRAHEDLRRGRTVSHAALKKKLGL